MVSYDCNFMQRNEFTLAVSERNTLPNTDTSIILVYLAEIQAKSSGITLDHLRRQ